MCDDLDLVKYILCQPIYIVDCVYSVGFVRWPP
jgi:hypothetical protein